MRIATFALFVLATTAVPATAQIITRHDASGRLVFVNLQSASAAPESTNRVAASNMLRTSGKPAVSRGVTAYEDLIRQNAEQHGVSADLVRAVIQAESGFNRYAVSPKGAMGLMQLMPATARDLGVRDPFLPSENIRGGVAYLAGLWSRFNQDVTHALAAYNAGAARVEQYKGVPPFRETQNYVKKITAATKTAKSAPRPIPVTYKWTVLVDGQPTTRYSNVAPRGLPFETIRPR
jgi:soluble lytic murein transglycosylase-like protein